MSGSWEWLVERWRALTGSPSEPPEDVELLLRTLELRRLALEVQKAHATIQPGKFQRVQASTGAYDDVLLECCRVAGVPLPRSRGPLSSHERFDAEMALLAQQVEW